MKHGCDGEPFFRPASLAFELYGALGDNLSFGLNPSRQEHYFQPSITFDMGQSQMLTFAFGIGLTGASDQLIRLNLGMMF